MLREQSRSKILPPTPISAADPVIASSATQTPEGRCLTSTCASILRSSRRASAEHPIDASFDVGARGAPGRRFPNQRKTRNFCVRFEEAPKNQQNRRRRAQGTGTAVRPAPPRSQRLASNAVWHRARLYSLEPLRRGSKICRSPAGRAFAGGEITAGRAAPGGCFFALPLQRECDRARRRIGRRRCARVIELVVPDEPLVRRPQASCTCWPESPHGVRTTFQTRTSSIAPLK